MNVSIILLLLGLVASAFALSSILAHRKIPRGHLYRILNFVHIVGWSAGAILLFWRAVVCTPATSAFFKCPQHSQFVLELDTVCPLCAGPMVPTSPKTGVAVPDALDADADFFSCSMHPQINQPQSGKCPLCGMDLIGVKKQE
jgi:hypothetical protein